MIWAYFLISVVSLLYTIWHVTQHEEERKRKNRVPGTYDFPVIGGGLQLLFRAGLRGPHWKRLHGLCQHYGKTFSTRTYPYTLMITEDAEVGKEILNSPDWSGRFPNTAHFKELTLNKDLGLLFSNGQTHREIRKFTIRTLRSFGFGELKAEELIENELNSFFEVFENERLLAQEETKGEILMESKFKVPTFNVLWRVMTGLRFEYEDPKILELIHAVHECDTINIGLDVEWHVPFLRFVPGCSPSRAKYPNFVTCHSFFIDLLNERRRTGAYKKAQTNFVDFFIHTIDSQKHNPESLYTDEQFQVTCVDLLFGGLETTGNLLEFTILYMIKFPQVQRTVQAEIDSVVGSERMPDKSDRPKLKYVQAVLLESLRWACVIPVNARSSVCDTTIQGYNVSKGTFCAVNSTVIHWSQEIWGDPQNFRPERFLNANNEIINADKIMPFGGGKRLCPGNFMAKALWLAFFPRLLQRYTFSPSPLHPTLKTQPVSAVASSPRPFYCCVTPRCRSLNGEK